MINDLNLIYKFAGYLQETIREELVGENTPKDTVENMDYLIKKIVDFWNKYKVENNL